jgi:DNA-binding beta-propeller fold protein YncE
MKSSRIAFTLVFAGALAAGSLVGGPVVAERAQPAQQKEIPYETAGDFLKLPDDIHLGEVAGAATTQKGNLFVYYQGGGPNATIGASRVYINGGARLLEFDRTGKFLREIGNSENDRPYAFLFAQGVRVDAQDNIWIVDRASRMVVKFDQTGKVLLTLGRRLEAVGELGSSGVFGRASGPPGSGVPGDNFNQPLDVAFDAAGNIFIPDGYGNARVAKFDKNGKFVKSWGATGSEQGQFNTPHSVAVDAAGNVYVADMGNKRIQVFDNNGTFKTQFANVGAPRALCISPGPQQFLYSSNSNTTEEPFLGGEIYKMQLDGTVVGRFGKAGKQMKEFGMANQIDCREPNTLYVAEMMNWRVQKLTLK